MRLAMYAAAVGLMILATVGSPVAWAAHGPGLLHAGGWCAGEYSSGGDCPWAFDGDHATAYDHPNPWTVQFRWERTAVSHVYADIEGWQEGASEPPAAVFRLRVLDGTTVLWDSGMINTFEGSIPIDAPADRITVQTQGAYNWTTIREVEAYEAQPIPPDAPVGLSATAGDGSVTLTWASVTGATGYHVHQDGQRITGTPLSAATYTATGLTNGQVYSFTVIAINGHGESPASQAVTATPDIVPEPPPPAPTGLSVVAGDGRVRLTWASVVGASGYHVYQDAARITETPVESRQYTATGLTNGQSYSFSVTSINDHGESPASQAVTAAPVETPPAYRWGLDLSALPGSVTRSLGSLVPIWMIPAGLIIAAGALSWAIALIARWRRR